MAERLTDAEAIRDAVRERSAAAERVERADAASCCGPAGCAPCGCAPTASVALGEAEREGFGADLLRRWTGGSAGALTRDEYERQLRAAGLVDGDVTETHRAHESAASALVRARKPDVS